MTNFKNDFHNKNHRVPEKDVKEYVLKRFQDEKLSNKIKNLVEFHTVNKYIIMAHDQKELKKLGSIVASYKKRSFLEIWNDYESHLIYAMQKNPTIKTHTNVIMHVGRYFLKFLNQNEKQLFFDQLKQFRDEKMTIGKILLEISSVAYRYDSTYLAKQTYFLLYADIDPVGLFQSVDIKDHI